ncbi:galactose metabolism- protein, partial [Teratosphaeriaceae sp. CCFEE 6253]
MGNSESKNDEGTPLSRKSTHSQHTPHRRREPSRDSWRQDAGFNQNAGRAHASRYSAGGATTTPPPPTATAIAPSAVSTSTSNISVTHVSTHTRTRSRTSVTSSLKAEDSASSQKSEKEVMGNAESKEGRHVRPPSRSQTLPRPASESEKPTPSPSARPMNVPHVSEDYSEKEAFRPSGPPEESPFAIGSSTRYDRPPRLPLPIEEELHTP